MADSQQELEKIVVSALEQIREPSGKNLIEAGIVASIAGEDDALVITCRSPGWPDPIRQRIEREIETGVKEKLPQIQRVNISWQSPEEASAQGQPSESTADQIKNVVVVGSGKGGVGKSTIAASIAFALKNQGHSVGIMDADVYGPSIPHMLGMSGQPAVVNNLYIPPEIDGIKVMSMAFLVPAEQAVVWRGPMLHKAVRDFLHAVAWGPLDYLIVDMPPGTGDVALTLSQQIPLSGGVIVCTPQDVALLDARKALNMFGTVKIPCLGIVENMSFFSCPKCNERTDIFGHGGARKWAEEAGMPFLGEVPINLQVRLNGDEGNLRDNFADDNLVRQNLLDIANRLVESIQNQAGPKAPTLEIVG